MLKPSVTFKILEPLIWYNFNKLEYLICKTTDESGEWGVGE